MEGADQISGVRELPSTTFLNLPEEKRQKLMDAATQEFASKSFADASINQIIKEAGVSRGSFYMYFADKEDLFRYLMQGYIDQLLGMMEELLQRNQGDIFAALLDLFDYVESRKAEGKPCETGALRDIIHSNAGMNQGVIQEIICPEQILMKLGTMVDTQRLRLEQEEDVWDILAILLGVAGPMLCKGALQFNDEAFRAHFRNVLNILRRGMEKPCAESQS